MSDKKVILTTNYNDLSCELPVQTPTLGREVVNIQSLPKQLDVFTHDPGFKATSSCESEITYIDAQKGELLHRGYPIEQLTQKADFLEVYHLLFNGEMPDADTLSALREKTAKLSLLDSSVKAIINAMPESAHPMAKLGTAVNALAANYHDEFDAKSDESRLLAADRLVAQVPVIAANIHRSGDVSCEMNPADGYAKNFLRLFFGEDSATANDETFIEAIDKLFILHADHEQNASTSTVRLAGSTGTDVYASVATGVAALWGPAHGGANEAVLNMLDEIGDVSQVDKYIEKAKDKADSFRLMGFGHRVYKNFDPRAKIIQGICRDVLAKTGGDPRLELAQKLEEIALSDSYFVERKLYPNVDFYSGIIYSALNIPVNMFTVMFAIARTVGWVSHWNEMISGDYNIGRPRQLYTGYTKRDLYT